MLGKLAVEISAQYCVDLWRKVHAAERSRRRIHRNPSHIFSNTQTHLGIKYRNCQANRKKSPGVVGKKSQVAMGESEGEREKCVRGRCLSLSGVPELIIVQGFRRQPAQKRSHSHYYIFTAPSPSHPASSRSPIRPRHI
jgi:hypothetical protein